MRTPAAGFDDFADLLPEPLLLVTRDGQVLAANIAATRFFGRSGADLVEQQLGTLFVDDAETVLALLKSFARSKQMLPGGLTAITASEHRVACRCEGALHTPSTPAAPAAVLLRVTRRDVGADQFVLLNQRIADLSFEVKQRRAAEQALQLMTERLHITLSSIGDAVIATDAKGLVTFLNPVAERLTGFASAEAIGQHLDSIFVIVNEQSRQPVESPVRKVLRLGQIVGLANHTVLLRRDGSEIPIDDSGAPIKDAGGHLVGVVLVFHDVSERHEYERQLVDKTRRLQQADLRKDEFLAMLAHELRNPLAPLKTGLHLLGLQHGAMPGVARMAAMMERQVVHMTRLVDDLLDVARLTRGTIELRRQAVSLSEVVERAVEMSGPTLEAHQVRLSVSALPRHVFVDGDETRLIQVFSNLLSNSAKFTPAGG